MADLEPTRSFVVGIRRPPITDGIEFAIRCRAYSAYGAQIDALHWAWYWFDLHAPAGPRAVRVDEIYEVPPTLYECVEG